MWVVLVVVVILFLVTEENKVNSNSDQLKLGWVCKFGVGFDNKKVMPTPLPPLLSLFQKNFEEFDQYFPVYFRWAYIIEEFFSMFRDKHLKKTIRKINLITGPKFRGRGGGGGVRRGSAKSQSLTYFLKHSLISYLWSKTLIIESHMTKPCALIGQLRKVLKMTFSKSDLSWGQCQPSLQGKDHFLIWWLSRKCLTKKFTRLSCFNVKTKLHQIRLVRLGLISEDRLDKLVRSD